MSMGLSTCLQRLRPGDALRRLADVDAAASFSNRRRTRRFEAFARLVDDLPRQPSRPLRILDVGGRSAFWEQRGWAGREDVHVVIVNLESELAACETEHTGYDNIELHAGDATNLSEFPDGSFDLAFSNSVIEHLQTFERQAAMAAEVLRLAPRYWVQTPNFWFPIEPHFLTPGWHWLPVSVRVALLRRRRWGWRGPCPDPNEARELVREVRLMRATELRRLFPGAELRRERIGPFVKSFMAVRAASAAAGASAAPARARSPHPRSLIADDASQPVEP
jgi:hypothetical protein